MSEIENQLQTQKVNVYTRPDALEKLAADNRIGRAEIRILLFMLAKAQIYTHNTTIPDGFGFTLLGLPKNENACFLVSTTREDLRNIFEYKSGNTISNKLTHLITTGYITRFQSLQLRTMFSFIIKPDFFVVV